MPADPVHHTDMTDSAWDGPAQEKKIQTPVSDAAAHLWAWHDPDGDSTTKGAHSFPHHTVGADGSVGAGNVKACQTIIGVLNGGMGGSSIPDKDRQGVYDHAAAHLKDAKVDAPDLKSRPMGDLEQRREMRSQLHNVRETRVCPADFQYRELPNGFGGTHLTFTGYASVTCANQDDPSASYEMEDLLGPWTESVVRGAFGTTLRNKADVAFLVNHEGITLARTKPGTLLLAEDATGLHVEARLDPANPLVQQIRSGIDRGDLDEMSFAFRVTRQEWNEDYTQRWITEVNMAQGDVSVVNFGANPHTGGTVAIRSADTTFEFHERHPIGDAGGSLMIRYDGLTEIPGDLGGRLADVARRAMTPTEEPPAPADPEPPAVKLADVRLLVQRNREREVKFRRVA